MADVSEWRSRSSNFTFKNYNSNNDIQLKFGHYAPTKYALPPRKIQVLMQWGTKKIKKVMRKNMDESLWLNEERDTSFLQR